MRLANDNNTEILTTLQVRRITCLSESERQLIRYASFFRIKLCMKNTAIPFTIEYINNER